jgi:hypothetical protein
LIGIGAGGLDANRLEAERQTARWTWRELSRLSLKLCARTQAKIRRATILMTTP